MRFHVSAVLGVALLLCCGATLQAQPGGRGGFGGGGASRLALLRIEAVQKELGLTEDQIKAIGELQTELRPARGEGRPQRGGERRRNRPEGDNNEARSSVPAQWYFVQDEQPRRQISEEDRARFREQAAERAKKEKDGLAKILKPDQLKRLGEIYLQVAGVAAFEDAEVAAELGITDEQKEKLAKVREESRTSMREAFSGAGEDREAARAKFIELRKSTQEKTLAVLTDDQRKKFETMQGKKLELPENALGGGRRGRGE